MLFEFNCPRKWNEHTSNIFRIIIWISNYEMGVMELSRFRKMVNDVLDYIWNWNINLVGEILNSN